MSGATKLMTAGGGGVNIQPASSIASDVTVNVPVTGVNNGTLVCSDSAGNVGIGTSSPNLQAVSNGNVLSILGVNGSTAANKRGILELATNQTPAANNNAGEINGIQVGNSGDVRISAILSTVEGSGGASGFGGRVAISTKADNGSLTERMRIDSSGNIQMGSATNSFNSGVGIKFTPGDGRMGLVGNSAVSGESTYHFYNTNATNNGYRFYVTYNGGVANYSGNNVNLSDERTKTNVELSGNYLAKICSIPVKLFNYKDEPEGEQRTLGVIAQDVESIAPELVNNEGFGETPEGEEPLKSIYTTDMMFAMMKAIQELSAKNDALEARIAALEAK